MSNAAGYQWLNTGTYRKSLPDYAVPGHWQALHTQAAIDAAVSAERERCAVVARNGCLVPPDGGSPTEDERLLCEEIARRICGA